MSAWLLVCMSISGTICNIHKKIICWLLWSFANLGWIIHFSRKEMLAEACLFMVYFILSVYGGFKWLNK